MKLPQVIEGTGEELERYLKQRFRLIPVSSPQGRAIRQTHKPLTPEEQIQALNALAEKHRNLPVLPPEAFERESLYEDDL